jgi:H+/Cl- antiporter ClcA
MGDTTPSGGAASDDAAPDAPTPDAPAPDDETGAVADARRAAAAAGASVGDAVGASTSEAATKDTGAELMAVLTSRGYRGLLLVSALLGVPVALVAWGFLVVVHELENVVWDKVPSALGMSTPTWWFGLIVLTLAGLLVGFTIAKLPGTGGHIPAHGLGGGQPLPKEMPSIVIAALLSLVLGAVVGPEAPLVAIGSGAVVVALHRTKVGKQGQALQLLAVAGSAAAISTIFGNPVVGAVLMLEVVGFAGAQVLVVLLPAVMAAGVGALVFTGLGSWTGFEAPTLTIPDLSATTISAADLLWTVPVSVLIALLAQATRRIGVNVAAVAARRPVVTTTAVGAVVGICAAAYALITGHPITDVLFSGETGLGPLVADPAAWSTGALIALVLFKSIAYAVSIGAFRGGPTFPALFIGAAVGILLGQLPGFGITAGIAVGMAAATSAVLRLPITSIVLVTLLLGTQALSELPIVMIAAVVGLVTAVSLDRRDTIRPLKIREARASR